MLKFEGVNRKGEIFFNGTRLGLLDGFMHRGNFDITDLLSKNGKNVLAVLVHWVALRFPIMQVLLICHVPAGIGCLMFPVF